MNDFDMIVHQMYGGHDIKIIPVSDVHLGTEECMQEAFERFVQLVKETPNVYVSLGGDLINNSIRSSIGSPFTEIRPHEQKRLMAKILEPIRDRILCGVGGNHERRSKKDADDDPMYDIMAKLDIEHLYRENLAVVKIQMGNKLNDNGNNTAGFQRPTYIFVVTHGAGGGMLAGAGVNRGQRYSLVYDGMDAMIIGHTHIPYNIKYSKIKIDPRNNSVTKHDFHVVCSTSWLEYKGYPVEKMLYPAAFADQTIILSGKHKEITIQTK